VSGALSVDTGLIPDGTYPVILTAYDDSGDPASVQAATVTIANHSGSAPATITPRTHGRGRLHVKVVARWFWAPSHTRMKSLRLLKLPHRATLALSCAGKDCPRAHWSAGPGHAKRLLRHLRRTTFTPGDRLVLSISERGYRTERIAIRIRAGRKPLMSLRQ
jgi:hypothetical protein